MIWTLTILGAIVVGVMAAFIVGDFSGSKALGGLIGTGFVVVVLFIVAAFATASAPASIMGFSHAQLEVDRIMTEQMAISVDPGMDALMGQDVHDEAPAFLASPRRRPVPPPASAGASVSRRCFITIDLPSKSRSGSFRSTTRRTVGTACEVVAKGAWRRDVRQDQNEDRV